MGRNNRALVIENYKNNLCVCVWEDTNKKSGMDH